MRTVDLIKSDLFRYTGRIGFWEFIRAYIAYRGFNFMVWFRLAQAKAPLVSRMASGVLRLKRRKYGIDIPKTTLIGAGLYIGHGGPCVVAPTARIGNNVNLSQFVTIGSNHNKAAVIGDNVYIGPSCVLVEDVVIGDNVTIGAGSIVVKSIPDNCTAAGNPARVLNTRNPGRYVNRRWPIST
jgi:serine O-acetyltransferase